MKTSKKLPLFFLLSIVVQLGFAQKGKISPGTLTTIEHSFTDGVIDGYTFYLPKSFQKSKAYPMILSLQGGSAVGGSIDVVNGWGIPKLLRDETDLSTARNQYVLDSFIVVSPHMTAGTFSDRQWYNQEPAIRALINKVQKEYKVDAKRIYITGLSRGGHGTWGLISRMSDIFAAAVPICGGIHGVTDFSPLRNTPIWVAHNTGDGIVSYDESEKAVAELEAMGAPKFLVITTVEAFKHDYLNHTRIFTSFKRGGHDAWTPLYGSLELYKWLLKQRLP